jgi:hypothetical protein
MTDNTAIIAGYTHEIIADADTGLSLNLLVKPGIDYNDTFRAWDMDGQEFIRVNGWLFSCEVIEDHAASLGIRHIG